MIAAVTVGMERENWPYLLKDCLWRGRGGESSTIPSLEQLEGCWSHVFTWGEAGRAGREEICGTISGVLGLWFC